MKKLFLYLGFLVFLVCISTQNVFAINAPDDNLIKQWGWSNVTTDFHAPSVKNRIKSVSFLTNDDIPDNVITSWDVSDASHPGKVKAWIVNSSKSSYFDEYYDLYTYELYDRVLVGGNYE